ncbi:MAG: metal ABC transporter substrate-binding protein, partial [Paraburkholderia nemoris]
MQRRFILKLAATLGAASLFSAATMAHAEDTIKVGVTGGPHAQIMEVVKT